MKCLFSFGCNAIPFLCKWTSLLRRLCASIFLQTGENQEECAWYQQTSYLMTHLQNQFAWSGASPVCLVLSGEKATGVAHQWKLIFSFYAFIYCPCGMNYWDNRGEQREDEVKETLVSGEAGRLFLCLTHRPCSDLTNFVKKDAPGNFLFISFAGSCVTE